jgi:hypothetical protein
VQIPFDDVRVVVTEAGGVLAGDMVLDRGASSIWHGDVVDAEKAFDRMRRRRGRCRQGQEIERLEDLAPAGVADCVGPALDAVGTAPPGASNDSSMKGST